MRCSKVAFATARLTAGSDIGSIAASACPAFLGRVRIWRTLAGSEARERSTWIVARTSRPGVKIARRKIQNHLADLLRCNLGTAPECNIKVGQDDLPRGSGFSAQCHNCEGRGRNGLASSVLTVRPQVGDCRSDIDRSRIGASRRIEQGDIAGSCRNSRNRAVGTDCVDAATIVGGDVADVPAGAEQYDGTKCCETKLH